MNFNLNDSLLEKMNITYDQFVEICLLIGVDYSGKLNRITIYQAYQWIKEFKTIDNLFKFKIITIHPDPNNNIKNIVYQKVSEIELKIGKNDFIKKHTNLIGLYELFKKQNIFVTFKLKKILTFLKDDNHFRNIRE